MEMVYPGSEMTKAWDTSKLHNQVGQTTMSSPTISLASFPLIMFMTAWESFTLAEGEIKRLRLFTDELVRVWVQAENGLLLSYSFTQGWSRKRAVKKNPTNG